LLGKDNDTFMKMVQDGAIDQTGGEVRREESDEQLKEQQESDGFNDPDFVDNKTFGKLPPEAQRALGNRLSKIRELEEQNQTFHQQMVASQQQLAEAMSKIAGSQQQAQQQAAPKYDDALGQRDTEEIAGWVSQNQARALGGLSSDDDEARAEAQGLWLKVQKAQEILTERRIADRVAESTRPLMEKIESAQQMASKRDEVDALWMREFGRDVLNDESPDGPKARAAQTVQSLIDSGAINPNDSGQVDAASFTALKAEMNHMNQRRPADSARAREGLDLGGVSSRAGTQRRDPFNAAIQRGDFDAAINMDIEAELRDLLGG